MKRSGFTVSTMQVTALTKRTTSTPSVTQNHPSGAQRQESPFALVTSSGRAVTHFFALHSAAVFASDMASSTIAASAVIAVVTSTPVNVRRVPRSLTSVAMKANENDASTARKPARMRTYEFGDGHPPAKEYLNTSCRVARLEAS